MAEHHGRTIRSIRLGVDSGKGFLKFDMTVEFEPEEKTPAVPDHSQKRVILLCVIPNAEESNALFAEVYRLLALPVHDYFHSFHADLKAIAYATGIDSGTTSHPCCNCERKMTVDVALAKQLTADKLRTSTSNLHHFKKFTRSGDDTAKKHANCSSNPLR